MPRYALLISRNNQVKIDCKLDTNINKNKILSNDELVKRKYARCKNDL